MNFTWYLAGPMSGIPQFNFPLFDRVAQELRGRGYVVISPAELDDPYIRAAALASPDGKPDPEKLGQTWGDFLARDVKIVVDRCQGIILLPGWAKSRGAKLESFVGLLCGHEFRFYLDDDGGSTPTIRHETVKNMLLCL